MEYKYLPSKYLPSPGWWQNLASHELPPWEVGWHLAFLPTVGTPEGAGSPRGMG